MLNKLLIKNSVLMNKNTKIKSKLTTSLFVFSYSPWAKTDTTHTLITNDTNSATVDSTKK